MSDGIAVRLAAGMFAAIFLCFSALAQQLPENTHMPPAAEPVMGTDINDSTKDFQELFDETEAMIERMQARLKRLDAVSGERAHELDFLNSAVGDAIEQIGGDLESEPTAASSLDSSPQDATDVELYRFSANKNVSANELRKELGTVAKFLSLERQTTDILKAKRQSLAKSLSESIERRAAVERELDLLHRQQENELAERDANLQLLEEAKDIHIQSLDFALEENNNLSKKLADFQSLEVQTTGILKAERQSLAKSLSESIERRAAVEKELESLHRQQENELAERDANLQLLKEAQDIHIQSLDFSLAENNKLSKQLADFQSRIEDAEPEPAGLSRYRRAFVGKLKKVVGVSPFFRAEEEHYIFQSDALFEQGSEVIINRGTQALRYLSESLLAVAKTIPADLKWILRIDGHTGKDLRQQSHFKSNLDFSAARSMAVMKFLISGGISPNQLGAVAFGDYQPRDPGNDEIAHRRNHRIEFRLTQR